MAWTNSKGFNFRASLGFVTDGARETFVSSTFGAYPQSITVDGDVVNCGWETAPIAGSDRDRSASVDRRLAGVVFAASGSGVTPVFRVDLPATGDYVVELALGDEGSANSQSLELRDSATAFLTVANVDTTAGEQIDATGVKRTSAADWVANQVAVTRVFASTVFRVVLLQPPSVLASTLAHVSIRQVTNPWVLTGTGPRVFTNLGHPLGAGSVEAFIRGAATGGSTTPMTLTAAAASSAVIVRAVGAIRSSTAPGTGTVQRATSATRSVSVAASAAVVRAISATKSTSSGSSASAVRQAGAVRSAAGTSSATVVRQVGAVRAATAPASALIARAVGVIRSASGSTSAAVVKLVGAIRSATASESATVASMRVFLLTLSASAASSATVQRAISTAKAASSAAAAVRVLVVGAVRSAAGSAAATVARQVGAIRAATQGSTATLLVQRVVLMTLSASTAIVASVSKQVQATRTAVAIVTVATVLRLIGKNLIASTSQAASMTADFISGGGPVFPAPADVRAGVIYGPNGNDYTGTLVATSGGGSYLRRR